MGGIFSKKKRNNKKQPKNIKLIDKMTFDDNDNNIKLPNSNLTINNDEVNLNLEDCDEEIIVPVTQPKLERSSILDKPNDNFRIHAMEQDGIKMSDTHYFMFQERNYRRWHSTKERNNPIEMYENSSRLFHDLTEEPLLPFDLSRHFNDNNNEPSTSASRVTNRNYNSSFIKSPNIKHNTLPVRRGRSDLKNFLYNQNRALIARLRIEIPQATDDESHGVLMGTNWNYEEAERRLKIELVSRSCGANYRQCEKILKQFNWDHNAVIKTYSSPTTTPHPPCPPPHSNSFHNS